MDIETALEQSSRALTLWWDVSKHPDVPAFSGGLLDAWPAWWVDAEPVLREESAAIRAYLTWRARG